MPADNPLPSIIVRYELAYDRWLACFSASRQIVFGGELPSIAIRKLFDAVDPLTGSYELRCDHDWSDTGDVPQPRFIRWDPPDLFFSCPSCNGSGEYVGLLLREECRTCRGRGVVSM